MLIALILLASVLISLFTVNLRVWAHDSYEALMSLDPGFSSSRNIIDEGGFLEKQSLLEKGLAIVAKTPSIIKNIAEGDHAGSEIPLIEFEIKFSNLIKINKDRVNSIDKGFLDEPVEVRARVVYNSKTYDAKVRLKGDLQDHWLSRHRFSLRVKLSGDDTILGMKTFSIQKPRSRQHPYEQAFQSTLNDHGNLTSNHKYVRVKVNGSNWGVMNLEEHLSAQFLEKKRKKDSLIFRFSDDLFWKNYRKSLDGITEQDLLTQSNYLLSNDRLAASIISGNKYLKDVNHRKVYSYILQKKLQGDNKKLFAVKELANLLICSFIWNNFHTLSAHNTRYYFNPYTLMLEPISSDQEAFKPILGDIFETLYYTELPSHFYDFFDDHYYDGLLEKQLEQIIREFTKLDSKLNAYNHIFPLDAEKKSMIIQENIAAILNEKSDFLIKLASMQRREAITNSKITDQQLSRLPRHVEIRHYDNGEIHVFPLIDQEVLITQLKLGDQQILRDVMKISGFKPDKFEPYVFQTDITGFLDDQISVVTDLNGNVRNSYAGPTLTKSDVYNPFQLNSIENHNFVTMTGDGTWVIKKGKYHVRSPLKIEGHLEIEEGVQMYFDEESYMLVDGTIDVKGTVSDPIKFLPLYDEWKGFYLKSNSQNSYIRNLEVHNTRALNAGILNLTGGFTVYESDLLIENLELKGTTAEDALNIVNSTIDITGLKIYDAASDAFDCDFCKGSIYNSEIDRSGGDGFDFSGSDVELKSVNVTDVKDKSISAGENSKLRLENGRFVRVGVGIAAKDASNVVGDKIVVEDYTLYAAMTYQKKPIFGRYSFLSLRNVQTTGTAPYKSQIGTELQIDGSYILGSELSVKDMYSQGIMKK